MSEAVITPLVAGGFSIVVALISYLAVTNKKEHAENGSKLDQLLRSHERIESKVDRHINDHAKGDV
jgi:hypothetical protein